MEEIKSTVEHLQDLIDAREDMKTSINNKGVQVSGGLKSYADAIDRIPQNVIDGDDLNVGDINVEYTENGSYNINPTDYELDALSGVGVTVNVPTKSIGTNFSSILQIKSNGAKIINAKDYGYDGLSQVHIMTNVPTKKVGTPPLPILITNNGSKTIDASDYNVDGLSQVELEINVPQSGGGGNYEIDFTQIGYSLEESKIANEANVIGVNNAIKRLDEWSGIYTDYNKWSFVDPDNRDNGDTDYRFSPWNNNDEVIIAPTIRNLNSDGKLVNYSYVEYQNYNRVGIFAEASALRYISPLDTSKVTDMYRMFENCCSLITIPLLDTSNVTNMKDMFSGCTSLTTIPQLNTSNVTNMEDMFNNCYSLASIPQLDTSKVIDMSCMFYGCGNLTSIPQLNTSKVTDMYHMFYYCNKLTSIPQLDTSNVTNMGSMFKHCESLTSIPQLDTSNVTNMSHMFCNCYSLTSIPQLDTSNVTDMSYMFQFCKSLTSIPLLDTSKVHFKDINVDDNANTKGMFNDCTSLENVGGFMGLKLSLDLGDCSKLTFDSFENIVNNVSTVTLLRTLTVNETAASNWESEDSTRAYNLIEMLMEKGWTLSY